MLKKRVLAQSGEMSVELPGSLEQVADERSAFESEPDRACRSALLRELRMHETRIGLRAIGSPIPGNHHRHRIIELEHELDQHFPGWRENGDGPSEATNLEVA
jgi:hypothetical protein